MMRPPYRTVLCLLVASLVGVLVQSQPIAAQTMSNSFGGLSESSNEPIDIESDVLVVQDKQKLATFRGNVKAVQGTTTLHAKELKVHYVGGDKLAPASSGEKSQPPAAGAQAQSGEGQPPAGTPQAQGAGEEKKNAQITLIEAKGDVVIISKDDQTTTSDWALYDLPAQLVTVGGNVVLTQGKNVLKGDRLVIDLKTGESRFEHTANTSAGGRIRALFMPKEKKGGEDASGDEGKPSEVKPDATAEDASSSADTNEGNQKPTGRMDAPLPLDPMRP
jgi:lipopolysaccharide export system protein LptA